MMTVLKAFIHQCDYCHQVVPIRICSQRNGKSHYFCDVECKNKFFGEKKDEDKEDGLLPGVRSFVGAPG